MKQIATVKGPIDGDQLGVTLMHEHFLFGYPGWYGDLTMGPFDREQCLESGIRMANRIKACGVNTIVDATPNESGRDPEFLKEISDKTGLQIICVTGYYYERGSASPYFKARRALGNVEQEIYDMFKQENTAGIGKTGIRAGIIKLASSRDAITSYEQWFFRAAAKASRDLDIPIITHTQEGRQGPEQAALILGEGADPKRVMIGHMCGNTDMDYLLRTLEQGVFIGFDRFGIEGVVGTPTDKRRIACLLGLLGLGYVDRIMLSQDYVDHWLGRPGMAKLAPDIQPTHLFDKVIPALQEVGVTQAQITTMMVDNPRRLLTGV